MSDQRATGRGFDSRRLQTENLNKILDAHAAWIRGNGGQRADLRGAYLCGADLRGVNLRQANMRGTDLRYANMRGADLRGAELGDAALGDAYLGGADLDRADLVEANLSEANLIDANLIDANLRGADLRGGELRGANLTGANLDGADLRGTRINWQSHDLIAELLRRAAEGDVERRKLAGLVLVSRDWCWFHFLALDDPQREWALGVLREYVREGDGAPDCLTRGEA